MMRASRSKIRALVVAVMLVVTATALFGWLMALPAARSVGAVVGHFPEGDSLLWKEGGRWLAETVRLTRDTKTSLVALLPWELALATAALLIPWSYLLVLVASAAVPVTPRPPPSLWQQTMVRLPMLFVLAIALLVSRVVVAALVVFGWAVMPKVAGVEEGRSSDLILVAVLLFGSLLWSLLRVVHDLAAVAAVARRATFLSLLGTGFRGLAKKPFSTYGGYLLSVGLQAFLLYDAALLVGKIGIDTTLQVVLVTGVHLSALTMLVLIRTAWLGVANALSLLSSNDAHVGASRRGR